MAHRAFRVNLILVLILSDYRGPIYMGSNMTPWVLQGFNMLEVGQICDSKVQKLDSTCRLKVSTLDLVKHLEVSVFDSTFHIKKTELCSKYQ